MGEVTKILYIVVVDDDEKTEKGKESFRYTRPVLQSTLQLMGCKARHAFKISKMVFESMKHRSSVDAWVSTGVEDSKLDAHGRDCQRESSLCLNGSACKADGADHMVPGRDNKSEPFEMYKKRTTAVVRRKLFLDVVCYALAEYKYVGPNQRADLVLACRIRERKESVTVLLCGTSGCGKSTLSALLGSRLGITTVISTDSIRHMMRSFVDEKENPLLWSSTYHAGEYLDPVAVADAKAKKNAKKLNSIATVASKDNIANGSTGGLFDTRPENTDANPTEYISPRLLAVEGYKAQSEMVIDSLDRLITTWEERKESVVVEGVHLSLNFVMGLMKKHPSIIPFMIYITNEEKHMERFAVRAKYMTLDPAKNKYIKYIRNIRSIQEYLCMRADKHLIPKINNTNVDKSVAVIHATVFGCLRRRENGEPLCDPSTNTVAVIDEEFRSQCAANSLSSKGMYQLIQRQGSTRHLMALLNVDGSVAKAWPVDAVDSNGMRISGQSTNNGPMYGPLQIGKAEPVNLQFGHFGISAWPSDTGGTSHASSVDESRDVSDNGSRYYSSCCTSPRNSDGPAKEPKEEDSVHGSDEEVDDPPEVDSDEDFSDDSQKEMHEEMEGSVDEESTKSDEEYDDLAMQDSQDNGYLSDDDNEKMDKMVLEMPGTDGDNNRCILRSKSESVSDLSCSFSSLLKEKNEKRVTSPGRVRSRKRSLSIPTSEKHGSVSIDSILFGTPQR